MKLQKGFCFLLRICNGQRWRVQETAGGITTGLYYHRARYLDPTTGRWTTQDPIGFAAGDANLYRYVGNTPTLLVDPSGLLSVWEAGQFGCGLVVGIGSGAADIIAGIGSFFWSPIQTTNRILNGLAELTRQIANGNLGEAARQLFPDLHRLMTEGDQLSYYERGRLTGRFIAQVGTMFLSGFGVAQLVRRLREAANTIRPSVSVTVRPPAQPALAMATAGGGGAGVMVGVPCLVVNPALVVQGVLTGGVGLSQGLAAQAPLFALMSTGNVHGGNGGCSTTPRLGRLTPEGGGVWRSAGGLRYGPDPRYGNRVQHVLRHAEDDATRAVEHGVFDAGRAGTLGVIDEAWAIAQRGGPGVASVVRGNRVEYTIDMGRRIGYVGGRSGAAAGHPAASHIRLIIANGTDVITAYPIIP
jgi:RHS repeat-associated protein